MTNSINDTQEKDVNIKPKKKVKGPIRSGFVTPLVAIVVLLFVYFKFFFDANLEYLLEFGATTANKAEVNIGNINTSFFGGSFKLFGLQATNPDNPTQNLIEIGEISFKFSWDALLRAKLVIEDASIHNIQVYSKRKTPGKVYIEEEVAEEKEAVADQPGENPLAQAADLIAGQNPMDKLKNLGLELKSEKRIAELEQELKNKDKEWKNKLATLPQAKEITDLLNRAKGVKIPSNPLKAKGAIKEYKNIMGELKTKTSVFNQVSKEIKNDINKYKNSYNEIDKLIKEDIANVQKQVNVGNMNMTDLSAKIFSKLFQEKEGTIKKYIAMVKGFIPPKGEKKEVKKVDTRHKGKNYRFPKQKAYPLFWLKKSKITSKVTESPYSGNLDGKITDLSSDSKQLGKPGVLLVNADFPHQKILGVNVNGIIDNTGKNDIMKLKAKVSSFPVENQTFSKSPKLELGINQAQGKTELNIVSIDQMLEVLIDTRIQKINYNINADKKAVKTIFNNIVADIPIITVLAKAKGTSDKLSWQIKSNLGKEIGKGLKNQLNKKVQAAKNKIKGLIDKRIGKKKQALKQNVDKTTSSVTSSLDGQKSKLDSAKNDLENGLKNKKKASTKKKAKKKAKKLLKKFGF